MNVRIGRISQITGLSWCKRCQTTWTFVKEHMTDWGERSGCFPLCEKCWAELTPEDRLPYYRQLWDSWNLHPAHHCWELGTRNWTPSP